MKVSVKEYRDRQNHATGALIVSIIAAVMVSIKAYGILFSDKEPAWTDLTWVLMLVVCAITWRTRENKLKQLQVDERFAE